MLADPPLVAEGVLDAGPPVAVTQLGRLHQKVGGGEPAKEWERAPRPKDRAGAGALLGGDDHKGLDAGPAERGAPEPLNNPIAAACNFEPGCLTQAFQRQDVQAEVKATGLKNDKTILTTLLAANSRVRILALNTYELDDNDPFTATGILDVLNAALAEAINDVGNSRVTLVDTTATFTPQATCELTEWCFEYEGSKFWSAHPTDAGYVTLTDLARDASRSSVTRDNHLSCRSGAYPKPVGPAAGPHPLPLSRARVRGAGRRARRGEGPIAHQMCSPL